MHFSVEGSVLVEDVQQFLKILLFCYKKNKNVIKIKVFTDSILLEG